MLTLTLKYYIFSLLRIQYLCSVLGVGATGTNHTGHARQRVGTQGGNTYQRDLMHTDRDGVDERRTSEAS